MKFSSLRLLVPTAAIAICGQAGAVVIVNTDFSSSLSGLNFDAATAPNTAGYASDGPNGTQSIKLHDVSGATGGASAVGRYAATSAPTFSTSVASQSQLQVSFDFAVTSMSTDVANSSAVPRILLRPTTATAQGVTIGLGRGAGDTLVLYAAQGNNASPGATNVLSYNLGSYSTADASLNNTGGYITFNLSLIHGGTTMLISATQGGNTLINGTLSGFSGHGYSNSNLEFVTATGSTGTSTAYIDNLFIQAVPEPAAVMLSSLGALALLRRRRA